MTYETILIERHDAVTLVRLNRPQALNALNSTVLKELIDAFAAYDADPAQRCLVLTGSEKAFAAGADIKEMSGQGFADMYGSNFFAGWEKVTATRKPWIAAVSGFALGGGCEVAMMADFIIADDTAKFGQPEIKLGVTPGMGGSQRIAAALGKAKAMEMCLAGRMMGADEAERGSPGRGREAHHRRPGRVALPPQPAGAADRGRPRPSQRRGLPRLHPRLPVLQGRDDHPSRPRAPRRPGPHHGERGPAPHRLRRGRPHQPLHR